MPKAITRRIFLKTLFLTAITPPVFAKKPAPKTISRAAVQHRLDKLYVIDNNFSSVDGWILPTKILTEGAV